MRFPVQTLVREGFSLIYKTIVAMNPEQGLNYHAEIDLSDFFRANFFKISFKKFFSLMFQFLGYLITISQEFNSHDF